MDFVVPENIHNPTAEGPWKFGGGGGVLKAKFFKGKYKPKLEFPEGWGAQTIKILCGGSTDIFWNNTLWMAAIFY